MVSSYTTNKNLEKPGNGDYVDTWNIPVNSDMDVIDAALGGTTSLNATSGSANLTSSQYQKMALNITGAMSANVTYTIPNGIGGTWVVRNATTDSSGGPWTVTIASGGGGSNVTVIRGRSTLVWSDGTNIRDVNENIPSIGTVTSVDVSGGTTGLTTSGGPITTNGTITIAGTLAITNGGTGRTTFGTGVQTALGANVTGSGGIVLATSAALTTPNIGTPSSANLTNAVGLPISTGVSGLGANVATFLATPSSTNLQNAVTDETGTGSLVFGTNPVLTTPNIGTPSFANLTNAVGLPISTGVSGLGANVATFLATPSSTNLRNAVTDETGTGSLVFATSPVLTTPNIGVPSFATLTNATGLPLTTGVTGTLAVANGGTGVTSSTGTGSVVLSTSPVLTTPNIGTPSAANLTNATGLPLTTGVTGTLAVANGGTGVTTSTGTGSNVLSNSPALTTPNLGTPSAANLTNATSLPLTTGVTGILPVANGGTGSNTSTGTGAVVLQTAPTITGNAVFSGANVNFSGNTVTMSGAGALKLPTGTTADRPTPATGMLRFNANTTSFEGYNGTAWGTVGGGATGAGGDQIFYLNGQTITTTYSIPSGQNAMCTGPITINSGVAVTVPSGSRWVVL